MNHPRRWFIAVDPGVRGCGVAIFKNQHLHHASYVRNPASATERCLPILWNEMAWRMKMFREEWLQTDDFALIVELPQVYRKSKGDPNDLLSLAAIVGALTVSMSPSFAEAYRPARWKGQVPKDIMIRRIKELIKPEEWEVIRLPEWTHKLKQDKEHRLAHNVYDAIGIGMYHVGRLD